MTMSYLLSGKVKSAVIRTINATHAHHEISMPLPAFGTAQQQRPVRYRHPGAVLRNLDSDVGVSSMIAALAPDDEPHMRGERLP